MKNIEDKYRGSNPAWNHFMQGVFMFCNHTFTIYVIGNMWSKGCSQGVWCFHVGGDFFTNN